MGLLFVLIFWAIIACVLSVILGGIFFLVAYLIVRKKQFNGKKRLLALTAITPGVFIGLQFILSIIGSVIVSEKYDVDYGFGDCWEAPLNDTYSISAIDLPEKAYIYRRKNEPIKSSDYDIDEDSSDNNIDTICKSIIDNNYLSDFDYSGDVKKIWAADDRVAVECQSGDSNFHMIYTFYIPDGCDTTVIYTADYKKQLKNLGLDSKKSITASDYFYIKQTEAHQVEWKVRNAIVLSILLIFWIPMIIVLYRNRSSKGSEAGA